MTKREFLDKLKKALANDLSGNVIRDNVDYYNAVSYTHLTLPTT